jgi:hypothetical protein
MRARFDVDTKGAKGLKSVKVQRGNIMDGHGQQKKEETTNYHLYFLSESSTPLL